LLPCLFRFPSSSLHLNSLECSSSRSDWKESGSRRGSSSTGSKDKSSSSSQHSSFNCNDFAPLGDIIDCNFNEFISVDALVSNSSSSLDFDFSPSGYPAAGGCLDGNIDSFLDLGSVDTSSISSGELSQTPDSTQPSSTSQSDTYKLALEMISHGDLNSLLSLQPHLQLNNYTMGLPLFPTPTPSALSASPVQESTPASASPSTASPASFRQSPPSIPPLTNGYRVQKTKSKPGPKPKVKYPSPSPPLQTPMQLPEDDDSPEVLDKRFRNNLAAKKYRQKKVDRISELESALADITKERDQLRLLLARKEAEGQVLREVMARDGKSSGRS